MLTITDDERENGPRKRTNVGITERMARPQRTRQVGQAQQRADFGEEVLAAALRQCVDASAN